MDFALVPDRAALLNIDLQNGFVDGASEGAAIVDRINRFASICREAGIPVIHTRHVLRPDGSNMGLLAEIPKIREGFLNDGAETAALYAGLDVRSEDVILEKPRFGAFHGTDLEELLRARDIDTVIVAGLSTPVCCETTAREAHARDFRVLFLSDGTACTGPEADAARFHQATLDILDGMFAQVITIEEVLAKIDAGARLPR